MECKIYCWHARGEIYLNPVFIPTAMSQHLVFGSMGLVVPVRQLFVARLRHGNTAERAQYYLHVDGWPYVPARGGTLMMSFMPRGKGTPSTPSSIGSLLHEKKGTRSWWAATTTTTD
jgi:hypothetical protein